ncbi:unnamed protein product [Schistosoma rodhaini]|uniref:Uncharacterized protein n=1 Tax=Schistosoma rodhaini TaxID=6188 RepID=A0AA85GCH8_9TREM|nr:unnamed protein product [Schistosoma rodhaini]
MQLLLKLKRKSEEVFVEMIMNIKSLTILIFIIILLINKSDPSPTINQIIKNRWEVFLERQEHEEFWFNFFELILNWLESCYFKGSLWRAALFPNETN